MGAHGRSDRSRHRGLNPNNLPLKGQCVDQLKHTSLQLAYVQWMRDMTNSQPTPTLSLELCAGICICSSNKHTCVSLLEHARTSCRYLVMTYTTPPCSMPVLITIRLIARAANAPTTTAISGLEINISYMRPPNAYATLAKPTSRTEHAST